MDKDEIGLRHVDGGDLTLSLLNHVINGGHGTSKKTRSTRFDLSSSFFSQNIPIFHLHQSLAFEKCLAAEETVAVELAASAAAAVEDARCSLTSAQRRPPPRPLLLVLLLRRHTLRDLRWA